MVSGIIDRISRKKTHKKSQIFQPVRLDNSDRKFVDQGVYLSTIIGEHKMNTNENELPHSKLRV
jgi:hypothetical protein